MPPILKDEHPEIAWREIAGMRDKLIHVYFGVNLLQVWKTINEDLSMLEPAIRQILSETEE